MHLRAELQLALSRRSMSKHDLQSLTGLLQHATKVIQPGRPFLRRLHALQSVGSHPHHLVCLNIAARADITWWHTFVDNWNGLSILWCGHLYSFHHRQIRRIWILGLWWLLLLILVQYEMTTPGSRVFHCHQKVISSGNRCSHLWQVLVRSAGSFFS